MMIQRRLKIIFMGTPDFAVEAFEALADRHDILCVYSQPPRPAGRGHKVQLSPIHRQAEARGIPVRHPLSLKRDAQARAAFIDLQADVAVVAAYGLLLPNDMLQAPRYGCINIHASLLPRWRGASPIQRAIWAGDRESGVCIMRMDAGLDTGPVLLRGTILIDEKTTATHLHDKLASLGARLIVEALDHIDDLTLVPQPSEGITYAALLQKEDGRIDWKQFAQTIDRQVRALNPWPGVWTMAGDKRLKVIEAYPTTGTGIPGTLLDRSLRIACGEGALQITKIHPQDGKVMDAAAFMNGASISVGDRLF